MSKSASTSCGPSLGGWSLLSRGAGNKKGNIDPHHQKQQIHKKQQKHDAIKKPSAAYIKKWEKEFDGKMSVDLKRQNLTDEDVLAIGVLLQTNNTLQVLNLNNNNITNKIIIRENNIIQIINNTNNKVKQ